MPAYNNVKSLCASVRLVETRTDFLFVYISSLLTMLAFVFGAWFVKTPDLPLQEIWYVFPSSVVIALVPPAIGCFLKTGRRVIQVMFGALLAPLIAAVIINGLSALRAIAW